MAIDPVCKMKVDEKTAKHTTEYMGKTYYFCAPSCKATFDKSPTKFRQRLVERGIHNADAVCDKLLNRRE